MASSAFSDILEFHKPFKMMYDINFAWTVEMAMSRNIASVHFQIMGAIANAFFLCMFKLLGVQFHFASIILKDYEICKLDRIESLLNKRIISLIAESNLLRSYNWKEGTTVGLLVKRELWLWGG